MIKNCKMWLVRTKLCCRFRSIQDLFNKISIKFFASLLKENRILITRHFSLSEKKNKQSSLREFRLRPFNSVTNRENVQLLFQKNVFSFLSFSFASKKSYHNQMNTCQNTTNLTIIFM